MSEASSKENEINESVGMTVDSAELTGRPTGLDCFKCDGELQIALVAGYKIAACDACHGLLVQNSDLSGLVNVLRAAYDGLDHDPIALNQAELHRRTECRACGDLMTTHPYMGPGNIAIDSCHHCKMVWLDSNELNRVVHAPGRREFRPDELVGFDPATHKAKQPLRTLELEEDVSAAVALAWLFS